MPRDRELALLRVAMLCLMGSQTSEPPVWKLTDDVYHVMFTC
jgi:hypothetical protein